MKRRTMILTLFMLAILTAAPTGSASAKGLSDGKIIFGEDFVLESGDTLLSDLVIMGGTATLEQDSLMRGEMILLGGSLDLEGEITGSVVVMGGTVRLEETSIIGGDLITFGATLHRAQGALIEGEVITTATQFENGFSISEPEIEIPDVEIPEVDLPDFVMPGINTPFIRIFDARSLFPQFPTFGDLNRILGWSVVLGLLAMLVTTFLADPTRRVARAAIEQPLVAGGLGLLSRRPRRGFS